MKLKNKGGWYDDLWNPITGTPRTEIREKIINHCRRFSGDVRMNYGLINMYDELKTGYYELNYPVMSQGSDKHFLIAPFGTAPTLHKYRLNTPESKFITGRNIFVNCFADTFDMPFSWIDEVLFVIRKNTQHNYILISDNRRIEDYIESRSDDMLSDNIWIGYQVTERTAANLSRIEIKEGKSHFFLDIDEATAETVSMLELFVNTPNSTVKQIEWILVTVDKNTSKKMLTRIAEIADRLSVPVFFDTEGADLPRVLPEAFNRHKISDKKKALLWAKCARCGVEQPKGMMYRIGWTKGRGCSSTTLGFICEECFEEYKNKFPSF